MRPAARAASFVDGVMRAAVLLRGSGSSAPAPASAASAAADALCGVAVEHAVPIPLPTSRQLLVRMSVAGVNAVDVAMTRGYGAALFESAAWHACGRHRIPGCEGVGTVVASGGSTFDVQEGDRVVIAMRPSYSGCHGEFVCADESFVARVPSAGAGGAAVRDELLASTAFAGCTAVSALSSCSLRRIRSAIVVGASGKVGSFALLHLKRMQPDAHIAAVCGERSRAYVASLGADEVAVHDATGEGNAALDRQYDLVVDASPMAGSTGRSTARELARGLVAPGGQLVSYSSQLLVSMDRAGVPLGAVAGALRLAEEAVTVMQDRRATYKWGVFRGGMQHMAHVLDTLRFAEERGLGDILLQRVREFSLDAVADAYAACESRAHNAVLRFDSA